jgi:hypothetical protein
MPWCWCPAGALGAAYFSFPPAIRRREAGESGLGAAGRTLDHGEGWRRGPQWRRFGERECEAFRVVAENDAGVKAVEDHLVWIEPVSGIVIDPRQDERGSS